jgi:hypothetical protein
LNLMISCSVEKLVVGKFEDVLSLLWYNSKIP